MSSDTARVTRLLRAWADGDFRAQEELVPIVYDTLRRLAQHYLANERPAHTLQPTALVHEAYVRLVEQRRPDWQNRQHFYGVAAHLMRQVLVDHARRRRSAKRGAGVANVELSEAVHVAIGAQLADILSLNDALDELATFDDRKVRVVELRYFGGFTEEETAKSLALSVATVRRDLRTAEAWLAAKLSPAT
jgi:RNA polymerase sigma-70 factor, ECF subfamily